MLVIDTGIIPENHPLRAESNENKPTLWVLSSADTDAVWNCQFLLEFGYAICPKTGEFGQWICSWQGSDDLNELIAEVQKYGLIGARGIVKSVSPNRKKNWVTRRVAERYIRIFGGGLYLCLKNPHWRILKNRDKQFKCYVAG